jgi:hypothetical protein
MNFFKLILKLNKIIALIKAIEELMEILYKMPELGIYNVLVLKFKTIKQLLIDIK